MTAAKERAEERARQAIERRVERLREKTKARAKGYTSIRIRGGAIGVEETWHKTIEAAHAHATKALKRLELGGYVCVYERAEDGAWVMKRTEGYKVRPVKKATRRRACLSVG